MSLKQAQTQKNKQKILESRKIAELEDEVSRLNTALQVQKNVSSDLTVHIQRSPPR